MPELLIDTMPISYENLLITEGKDDAGAPVLVLEGPFGRYGSQKNANKRYYPEKVWDKQLAEDAPPMKAVKSRGMAGHLEHPEKGVTDSREICCTTTDLRKESNGIISGRMEVLKNTQWGKQAAALIEARIPLGVSSRGRGTVDSHGAVQDDYELKCFDLVFNPSVDVARPTPVEESETEEKQPVTEQKEAVMDGIAKVRALETEVRPLVEQDLDGLPRYQLSEISSKILEASVRAGNLITEDASTAGAVSSIQGSLAAKRNAIEEALRNFDGEGSRTITEDVDTGNSMYDDLKTELEAQRSILEKAGDELDQREEQYEAAVALSEALVERTEAATKLAESLNERTEAATSLCEALVEEAAKVKVENAGLRGQLDEALGLLGEITAVDVGEPVSEAVEEAIQQYPVLNEARTMLEKCESVEQVNETVNTLRKLSVRGTRLEEDTHLPVGRGKVQSEDEVGGKGAVHEISEDAPKGVKALGKIHAKGNLRLQPITESMPGKRDLPVL